MTSVNGVHLLKVGSCRHFESMTKKNGHNCMVNFPAIVGVIDHKVLGPILFDTGYDERFFAATHSFPETLYRMVTPVTLAPEEGLLFQLNGLGLGYKDIRGVFLSHFHGDHVAGLTHFETARIFCAHQGLKAIRQGSRLGRVTKGLLAHLVPHWVESRAEFFENAQPIALDATMAPFLSGMDVLGDQSLIAVELEGHCKGHWGLLVQTQNLGRVFFIGDAAWSHQAIVDNCPPPSLTTTLLGDTKTYRQTLADLHSLQRAQSVTFVASHCEATFKLWQKKTPL